MSKQQGIFEHYQLLKKEDGSFVELGHGAMGVTYKAFDTNLRCAVALKVISAAYLNDPTAAERFLREARGAAKLRHRNVASVFHLGRSGDSYFYSMEFIEGETLDALVKRDGALDLMQALDVAAQVSNALIAAAKQGLVHRDIKPSNLMLILEDDGEMIVKVIDFGLVKSAIMSSTAGALTSGGFVGTPYFASPEQLDQQDEDIRSDIYSLGVTFWFMLTGRPTFMGSVASVIAQHMEKAPSFESLAVLPAYVVDTLRKMLEKDVTKRFQNPTEVRAELKRCMEILRNSQSSPGRPLPTSVTEEFQTIALSSTQGLRKTPSPGATLADRYRLIEDLNAANPNHTFHAEDVALRRRVRLKMVRTDPASFARVQQDADRVRSAGAPNFIEVLTATRTGMSCFVVLEWLEGFSLLELLRARHELTSRETLKILEQMAPAVDKARALGLLVELELRDILIHFPEGLGQDPGILLRCPLAEWPAFLVKVNPLGSISEVESLAGEGADRTMVAAPQREPGADIVRLGELGYELLGGKPGRFAPLASLTESGNEALRRCMARETKFETAGELTAALGESFGIDAGKTKAPASHTVTPAKSVVPGATPKIAPQTRPTPAKKSSLTMLLAAGGVGVLALVGIGVAWVTNGNSGSSSADTTASTPASKPSATPTGNGNVAARKKPPEKGSPWKNSLDVDYIPLGDIHFAAIKTRMRDFKAFIDSEGYEAIGGMATHQKDGFKDHGSNSWDKPGFIQTPGEPVIGVSYNDARHYCDWLTKKERGEGSLRADQAYRLPTDHEWSEAIGLSEEIGATPEERSGKIKGVYPWGSVWPPPPDIRNYAGIESRAGFGKDWQVIPSFSDSFQRTAPVSKYGPTREGIYDLGGNAWEWVQDSYDKQHQWRALRGGAWTTFKQEQILSSFRLGLDPSFRQDDVGFRCVIAADEGGH